MSQDIVELSIYILWIFWKTRNLWVFKYEMMPEKNTLDKAISEWQEYLELEEGKVKKNEASENQFLTHNIEEGEQYQVGYWKIYISATYCSNQRVGPRILAFGEDLKLQRACTLVRDSVKSSVAMVLEVIRLIQLKAYQWG